MLKYLQIQSGRNMQDMTCWHCDNELKFNNQMVDFSKLYYCSSCDKWYEMRKDKERVNGAVPVRVFELESRPQFQVAV